MSTRLLALSTVFLSLSCASAGGGQDSVDARVGGDGDGAVGADAQAFDCASALTGWHPIGGPLDAMVGSDSNSPAIAVDPVTNDLYVAWVEGDPADGHVSMWNGSSWQALGGDISVNPDNSPVYSMHLAVRDGVLVLAHAEAGGETSGGFHAQRWLNGSWQAMGPDDLSTSNVSVSGGAAGFDDNGDPVVAWSQYPPGEIGRNRIHVSRFDDRVEIPLDPVLGGVAGPGASALTPSLSFDGGREVVAFSESGVRVFIRNQQDTGWEPLGGDEVSAIGSALGAHSPRLARSAEGELYLAVAENDPGTSTANGYLLRWTGFTWETLPGVVDLVPGEHGYVRALTVDGNGQPAMAVTEGTPAGLYIMGWNNGSFSDLGSLPLSAYSGTEPVSAAALATDACGRLVVAFAEANTGGERAVHVYRFYQ